MTESRRPVHFGLTAARALGEPPAENLAVPVFRHGSLEVEWYAPRGADRQQPHERDEIYVVAQGAAEFFDGRELVPVAVGSFLFVPAGHAHRFEAMSDDFAVWVFFYGRAAGKRPERAIVNS